MLDPIKTNIWCAIYFKYVSNKNQWFINNTIQTRNLDKKNSINIIKITTIWIKRKWLIYLKIMLDFSLWEVVAFCRPCRHAASWAISSGPSGYSESWAIFSGPLGCSGTLSSIYSILATGLFSLERVSIISVI